jgi:hypothetical protein
LLLAVDCYLKLTRWYQVYKIVTELAFDCWFLEGVDCISLGGNLILNFELWLVPCLRGDKGAGMVGIFGGK